MGVNIQTSCCTYLEKSEENQLIDLFGGRPETHGRPTHYRPHCGGMVYTMAYCLHQLWIEFVFLYHDLMNQYWETLDISLNLLIKVKPDPNMRPNPRSNHNFLPWKKNFTEYQNISLKTKYFNSSSTFWTLCKRFRGVM